MIHLLDDPLTALGELNRVCKDGGMLIIPTYMNKDPKGKTSGFAGAVGKAGADFKRQFTVESYRQFFLDAGYRDVKISLARGRVPCAVAVITKGTDTEKKKKKRVKKEASFLTEEAVDTDSLKTAIDATGYSCLDIVSAPYEKKGLFGWF